MKGENRLKILEFIKDSVESIEDLIFIFTLPYGTSYSRAETLLEKRRDFRGRTTIKKIDKKTRRRFSDFLYRLKRDELVYEVKKDNKCFLKITLKGAELLQKRCFNIFPVGRYESIKDKTLKIIIFDIPEKEKRKREWLRYILKNLGFEMLQKSVWAGKIKLPEEFIKDLEKINILSYVEIFAISRTGTLKQIADH